MRCDKRVRITPGEVTVDGNVIMTCANLTELYRATSGDYPKFFKMDGLCRLGFLAAELLLGDMDNAEKEHGAIILFNRNGSLITDRNYMRTISGDSFFPSPALFVYTLANIVTGEIAIRHHIHGETSFHVLSEYDEKAMMETVRETFLTSSPAFILAGWADYENENDYLADLMIITNH